MSQQTKGTSLLSIIDQMRECRKKQKAFRQEKNTPNYKAMIESEDNIDKLLSSVRCYVVAVKERNVKVMP